MVFFTSLLIVVILYYLQAEGLIFVTIIAVGGELINILMTQTASKASEKKITVKFSKIVQGYKTKIASQKKTIQELETLQEESVRKALAAKTKIEAYEKQLKIAPKNTSENNKDAATGKSKQTPPPGTDKKKGKTFVDLPAGSNRKDLPI